MTNETKIMIIVYTNDGDYTTEISSISEKKLKQIKPLIEAISAFKPYKAKGPTSSRYEHHHNYPYGECCREDLGEKTPQQLYKFPDKIFELFEEYVPWNEYGIHTIENIEVFEKTNLQKLL